MAWFFFLHITISFYVYFINFLYYFPFPFLKGYRLKKNGTMCPFCVPIHKKKKKNTTTISNETGSRSPCMRPSSDPPKMKNSTQTTLPHFNFSVTAELNDVTSRLIILINEEINEANCMVRNSAKLDRRTKQHTQFGVCTSDGSRDVVRTKSWRKKKKKKTNECEQNHIASPTGIAKYEEMFTSKQGILKYEKVATIRISFGWFRRLLITLSWAKSIPVIWHKFLLQQP